MVPDLDARSEAAILRCLERDPGQRFQRASEVTEALTGGVPDGTPVLAEGSETTSGRLKLAGLFAASSRKRDN